MKINKIALLGLMFAMIPAACAAYDQYAINVGTIVAVPFAYGVFLMRKVHQKRLQNKENVQEFKKSLTRQQLERFEELYQPYDTWKGSYISALIAGFSGSYVYDSFERNQSSPKNSYSFVSPLIFSSTCVLAGLWQTEHLEEVNAERFEQAKGVLQAEIQEEQNALSQSSKKIVKK